MDPYARFTLPAGWLDGHGVREDVVEMRPLRGADEEWLHALSGEAVQVRVAVSLLARCVRRIGPHRATPAMIRELAVGDAEFLMLKLRALTFGERVEMVLRCPRAGCGARMDVSFMLEAVPVRRSPQQPEYRLDFAHGLVRAVRFRLPRVGDLEALEGRAATDELLERCVLAVDARDDGGDTARLPAHVRASIEAEMARLAAEAEGEIEAECPECGHTLMAALEPTAWLLAEVARRRREFETGVHLLSFHYHWPLRDVLGMSRARRQHYVRLLLDEMDRPPGAAVAVGRLAAELSA